MLDHEHDHELSEEILAKMDWADEYYANRTTFEEIIEQLVAESNAKAVERAERRSKLLAAYEELMALGLSPEAASTVSGYSETETPEPKAEPKAKE